MSITSVPTEQIRTVRVAARRDLALSVIELVLESADDTPLPDWEPGAHIDLRLGDDLIRQYSLVRTEAGRWTVAVLVEDGGRGGSKLIDRNLHAGSVTKVSGPRNHFAYTSSADCLLVGGGIGITPLIEMCRSAQASGARWRLVYLGRSRQTMAYVDDLEREFGDRVEVFAAAEGRRFDVAAEIAGLAPGSQVYCCGPDRLMNAVESTMIELDRAADVHLEHFHPVEIDDSANVEFTVYAAASGIEFVVPADESILMAADFEGVVVPGDCLEGTCGSCETRVLRGQVDHRDSILSATARQESRTMMICVSRAKTGCDRLELDL